MLDTGYSDTAEGRTVFVRNVSFEMDHDRLYAFFVEFGPLEFAKVVLDPSTGHSRGTGFVKFVKAEDAARVLSEFQEPMHLQQFVLDGRTLHLSIAIPRQDADRLRGLNTVKSDVRKANEGTQSQDSNERSLAERLRVTGRNLHLARVGLIRAGTASAEGLGKEDLAKRESLLQEKQMKLKNPNIFISDHRLCVRNLPLTVTDDQLRQICLTALHSQNKRLLTECRVMRNLQPGKQQFRSLGYAFISFKTHADAMKVLNVLNNNPDTFPNQRRPIVEFSLENMLALEKKRQRAEKSSLLQTKRSQSDGKPKPYTKATRTQSAANNRTPTRQKLKNNKTPMRILPKTLGVKRRHRNRVASAAGVANKNASTKPKSRLSRNQVRSRRHKSGGT